MGSEWRSVHVCKLVADVCVYSVHVCLLTTCLSVLLSRDCLWALQRVWLSWLCISVTSTVRRVLNAAWQETHTAPGMVTHAAPICRSHAGRHDTYNTHPYTTKYALSTNVPCICLCIEETLAMLLVMGIL